MTSNHDYKFAVLTISDSGHSGLRKDSSGDLAIKAMPQLGYDSVYRDIVPDQIDLIASKLIEWADSGEVDVIITTGGTGVSPRDRTPEATRLVLDYEIPGIPEAIRISTRQFTEMSMCFESFLDMDFWMDVSFILGAILVSCLNIFEKRCFFANRTHYQAF